MLALLRLSCLVSWSLPLLPTPTAPRFASDKDVEIASRVARVWDEDGNHDAAALDLGEVSGGCVELAGCTSCATQVPLCHALW